MLDACDVCESRRTPPTELGTDEDGSSGSSEMLLRLLKRPIEPTAGEVRSGMGGGPPIGAGRGPAGRGGVGARSSVGLSAREETEERDGSLPGPVCAMLGRHTFYKRINQSAKSISNSKSETHLHASRHQIGYLPAILLLGVANQGESAIAGTDYVLAPIFAHHHGKAAHLHAAKQFRYL